MSLETSASDVRLQMPSDVRHHLVPASDGGIIHAVEAGEGRPVLLVHGLSLTSAVWAPQLRHLARTNRVIALDVRGHGRSRAGQRGLSLSALASDVTSLIAQFDLRDLIIVGHSMGGMSSLLAVQDDSARRISGIVLLSSSGGPVSKAPGLLPLYGTLVPSRRGVLFDNYLESLPRPAKAWNLARVSFGRTAVPAQVRLTWNITAATAWSTITPFLKDILRFDASDLISAIAQPVILVVGSRDLVLPPYHSKRLFQRLANRQLWTAKGAGHMLMLERSEAVHQAVASMVHADLENGTRRFLV